MSKSVSSQPSARSPAPNEAVDLRDPYLAAILAWLIPGAGHWYQRRRSKAVLFFLCIAGTFGYGLWLGEGRVVYAAWGPSNEEKRLPFFCQAGVGVAALPAVYQARRFNSPGVREGWLDRKAAGTDGFWDRFMVPPRISPDMPQPDDLDTWNKTLNRRFELGTVYTMVAGLLNVLVIFDAFGGPAYGYSMKKDEEEDDADADTGKKPPDDEKKKPTGERSAAS